MKYNNTTRQKLHKEFCEIEGCNAIPEILHWHHIVERTEINTCNDPFNLAVLCPTHHALVHGNRLEIIGVYPSTAKYGRLLIYKLDGIPNIPGIEGPHFKHQNPQTKLYLKDDGKEEE